MSNRQTEAGDPRHRCPLCGKPATPAQHPFCSAACRDRDLIAWLDDRYKFADSQGKDAES